MKLFRIIRISLLCGLCTTILYLCSGCGYVPPEPLRKEIALYVNENKEYLVGIMGEVDSWSEQYYNLFVDDGSVGGNIVQYPYNNVLIVDNDILDFFHKNSQLYGINYPVNSDVLVFYVKTAAAYDVGFYYSPNDKPAWISSEQLIVYPNKTGQYMNYPFISKGDGWVPDKSVLNSEDIRFLKNYELYTERICENFFYFESWY